MEFLDNIYWRSGQPLTMAERNLIIYFLGAGLDNKDIAIALSRGKRTIDKWVNRFQATGEMQAIKHRGPQRATTIEAIINANGSYTKY
jgi:transposase